jgi:hypothetical protein
LLRSHWPLEVQSREHVSPRIELGVKRKNWFVLLSLEVCKNNPHPENKIKTDSTIALQMFFKI